MNHQLAPLLVLVLVGPSFTGCLDGGPEDPSDSLEQLLAQAPQCVDEPNSVTQGGGASASDNVVGHLSYATAQDRTLLRWIPPSDLDDATYTVTRTDGGSQTTETVSPVTDPAAAEQVLDGTDARWPDLTGRLMDAVDGTRDGQGQNRTVETVPELVSFLHGNERFAQVLAQRYYPVAMVLGQAYLDTEDQDGTTYTYEVEGTDGSTTESLGSADVPTGQLTDLPKPLDPTCVSLERDTTLRAQPGATWGELQQQQRVLHLKVLLRWNPPNADFTAPERVNGFDVFRAEVPQDPDEAPGSLADLDYERITEDPVQPKPTNVTAGSKAENASSEAVDFYHVDETPSAGDWIYRVAPRDLLGTPRDPAQHPDQLSTPLVATSFDFEPPAPPANASANQTRNNSAVLVNWTHPNITFVPGAGTISTQSNHIGGVGGGIGDVDVPDPTTLPELPRGEWVVDEDSDLSHFAVYRSFNASARPPSPIDAPPSQQCTDETRCWVHVGNTTSGVFLDTDTLRNQARWYQVRAIDDSETGNPSAWAGPVHETLHDETPPPAPGLGVNATFVDPAMVSEARAGPVATGDTYGPVLEIDLPSGDDDTTRARIQCQFEGNQTWVRIATVPMEDDLENVPLSDHYDPPTEVEAQCRARSVDAQGNVGDPSPTVNVTFGGRGGSQELPHPVLVTAQFGRHDPSLGLDKISIGSQTETTRIGDDSQGSQSKGPDQEPDMRDELAGVGVHGVRLNWSMPEIANLEEFEVVRTDPKEDTETTWRVDRDRRTGVDVGVVPGTVYEYKVRAIPRDTDSDPTESIPLQSGVSQSPHWADVDRPERPLGHIDLTVNDRPRRDAVTLDWRTRDDDNQNRLFAVFRSIEEDTGYIQQTPIQTFGPPVPTDLPGVAWRGNFSDQEVHRNYWYTVVEFDRRTGEPIRASDPKASTQMDQPGLTPTWSDVHLRTGIQVSKGSCQGEPPSPGEPVAMAEGYELVVDGIDSTTATSADGEGVIEVTTSEGTETVQLDFEDLSVTSTPPGEPRAACQGIASRDLGGAEYPSDGLETRIHEVVVGPRESSAVLDAVVDLPESVRWFDGTRTRGSVPLDNVSIQADETVTFNQAIQGDCRNPGFGFKLQTAPVQVVPDGQVTVTQEQITLGGACTEHNVSAWNSDRTKAWLGRGRNDGYLEPTLHGQGSVTVTPEGLDGRFRNATLGDEPARWRTSAPQGFDVEVRGAIEVRFDDSRVAGGSLTDGAVSFSHYTEASGYATSDTYEPGFTQLDLEPDGLASGTVSLGSDVAWNRLSVDPDQWGLLLGGVTFDDNPGRDLIAPLSSDPVDAGPLGDAYLNPGLNVRTASETLQWRCSSGSTFDTAMDAHLRRGGMNHAFRALIEGSTDIDIHGYDGSIRTWSRAFLDNDRKFHETVGKLQLPAPSDVTFDLDPMELTTEGCIKGGSGLGHKTLDYWKMDTRVDALEFRTPEEGVPHDGDALLFAQGTYEVPHLDPSSGSGGSPIPTEYAFLPDGDVHESRVLLDEPLHEVDGYPFLLEGFRLSDHGNRESPAWEPQANLDAPPSHSPADEGFLELEGRLITPYFGKLTSDSGEAPKLRFTSDDHYLGFDRRPRVEKVWVDVDAAQLVWAFDLVYVQDPTDEAGTFTAFDSYEFLPLGVLFHALEKPRDLARQGFDRVDQAVADAVVEAQDRVSTPFDAIRQGQDEIVGEVRTQVLQGLDTAHADVTEYIDRYFEKVRAKINATGPSGATAAQLRQNITADAFHWFTQVVRPVQDTLQALEDFRANELQGLLDTLTRAQDALSALQSSSVDTHRILRAIVDQLERATDLLGPDIGDLPQDLGSQVPVGDLVSKLEGALTQAVNLEQVYANALGNIQPALHTLSEAIAAIRSTVQEVDAAIGDMVTVGNRAIAELRNARDTVASLVPDQTGDVTATVKQSLLQETYRLQSAVKDPVDTVHQRVRSEFNSALNTLDTQVQNAVDDVHFQVNQAISTLGTSIRQDLDALEQQVVAAIEDALQPIREALSNLRLVYLDAAPVLEPGTFSAFLGLASAVAAVRSADETVGGAGWSGLDDAGKDRWRTRIGWDETAKPYGEIYDEVSFSPNQDHTDSVDVVDTWLQSNEPPEDQDVGAGTGGLLQEWGVDIREGRGSVSASSVGDPRDNEVQVDEIELRVKATVGDEDSPAFHADVVGMNIDRHGEYYVFGRDIQTSIVKKDLSADVDLLINTSEPRFEGGLTVYDFDIEQVYVAEAGAAVGVGETILYVGVKFDGIVSTGGSQFGVGGVVLAGKVDPSSQVLGHHFPDAIEKIQQIPAEPSDGNRYVGMYLQVHVDVPLPPLIGAEFGCVLDLNVGGRLGLYYFQEPPQQTAQQTGLAFGIKIGGYTYGTVVCAIDARGEITVSFDFAGHIPKEGTLADAEGELTLKGTTWVAAGVGDCEPGTWKGWNNRWWGDSWCAQGGAYAEVEGTGPLPFDPSQMEVDPHVEADAEGPF